jgi:hypothetical protein
MFIQKQLKQCETCKVVFCVKCVDNPPNIHFIQYGDTIQDMETDQSEASTLYYYCSQSCLTASVSRRSRGIPLV